MWTDTPEGRQLIANLSRQVVDKTAPEELDMFDELLADYYANPHPPEKGAHADDDTLAFGVAEAFIAVTPVAAAVVSSMLTYILQEVIKTTQEEGAKAIAKKISDVINPQNKETALTQDQLQQVRKQALKQAKAFGMDNKHAGKMADALIGRLVLAQ